MPGRILAAVALTLALISVAAAAGVRYENARFGYVVEVPAGFSEITEADNSDGGTARAAAGNAELAVWGANLLDDTFAEDVRSRIASDEADGWSVSYRTVRRAGASWSGAKGGRVAYARAIPGCDGQAAYVRLEYDRAAAKGYDPIVRRLVARFRATGRCL